MGKKHPIIATIFIAAGLFLVYLALTGFSGLPIGKLSENTSWGITGNPLILVGVGAVDNVAAAAEITFITLSDKTPFI